MNNTVKRVRDGVRIEFEFGSVVTLSVKDAAAMGLALTNMATSPEPLLQTSKTWAFFLHDAWHLLLDGVVVDAEWNCKGAAEAAIPIERARRAKKLAVTV